MLKKGAYVMKKSKQLIALLAAAMMLATNVNPVYASEITNTEKVAIVEELEETGVTETVEETESEETTEEITEATENVEDTEVTEEATEATEKTTEVTEEATEATEEVTEVTEEATEVTEEVTEETETTEILEDTETVVEVTEESEMAVEDEITLASMNGMKIYAIYLGGNAGDAVLVQSGSEYLLMDMGECTAGKKKGAYASVKKLLDDLNVKNLSLYYSHFHGDHTGGVGTDSGLDWLTSEYNVKTIYAPDSSIFNGKLDYSDTYEKIERISSRNNANTKIKYLKVGDTFSFGGVSVEIIGPVGVKGFTDPGAPSADASVDEDGVYDDFVNNCSLVARLTCGNVTYLTAGDAKSESEKALIKKYKNTGKLDADIYKLSHHGIAPANSEEFLKYVTPVCSFGMNGTFTGNEEYGNDGKVRRMTYSSKQNASAYGLCYMVADEKDTFVVDVKNNALKMYRYSNMGKQLKGIVKTVGSYGISYDGKNIDFDFYDYYYLGEDSKPITGIQAVDLDGDGKTEMHLFQSGGELYAGTWGWDENNKFVYKPWFKVGSDWQYYEQKTAIMATGWKTIDGEKYYFDKNTGYRKSGICEIDGNKYFFKESGVLYVNRWINLDGKKRYADKNGVLLTGFQTIDGGLYYLDPDNEGIAVTGGTDWPIQKIKGKYYAVKNTGLIFTGGWKKYTSRKTKNFRYFDKNGVMKTGWFEDKDGKYYLQTSGKNRGMRTIGTASIDSVTYAFSAGGKLIKNSWYNDSSSGKDKEHWMYFGKDGKQVTGWKTIDKEKYYFDKKTGYRATGLTKIKSKYYYFTDGGKMRKNKSVTVDGYKCKLDKNGVWKNLPSPAKTKFTSVKAAKKSATVQWSKKKGVTGYEIYMATSKKGKYSKQTTITKNSTTKYTKKKLSSKKTYYFKVRSYVKVGGYKFYSDYSSVKSVKAK